MEKRREDREKRLKSKEEEVEKYCQECPKIQQQFSDEDDAAVSDKKKARFHSFIYGLIESCLFVVFIIGSLCRKAIRTCITAKIKLSISLSSN